MEGILIVLGCLAVVVLFVFGFIKAIQYESRKREKKLNDWAIKRGLSFSQAVDSDLLLQSLEKFKCFSPSKEHTNRGISNVLEGKFGRVDAKIFDYNQDAYSVRNPNVPRTEIKPERSKVSEKYVVFFFKSPELNLFPFSLRPEGLFDKGVLFGSKDIDLSEHPKFSKQYVLTGEIEEKVRLIFTPEVISYFENHEGSYMEGYGDEIVFYKPTKFHDGLPLSEPDKMETLLEQGLNVVSLFAGR